MLLTLVACHGGTSPGVLPSQVTASSPSSSSGNASFSVTVPPSTSGKVAQSVVVTLVQVNGATSAVKSPLETMNLSATTPGCMVSNGTVMCTARARAPNGNDTFTVATYSGPNATGTRLSFSQTNAVISTAAATACAPTKNDSATLRGTP
ncbi:MAG TPA: hypothetical protein VKT72_04090 [Candidatus Baltobacteraceae bacterium]|nr:hypothetical protein [Candidatus Baltobacteraceae bacterium]